MKSPLKSRKGPSWFKAYRRVISDPILTPADKIVFQAVKSYADADGSNCFPSAEAIMDDTGLCRDTVFACYARIEMRGLFTRVQRHGQSNLFVLHDEEWAAIQSKTRPRGRRKKQTVGRRKKADATKSHVQTADTTILREDPPSNVIDIRQQA